MADVIQQTPRLDDFDIEVGEGIPEKWDYKRLAFYDLNRYQQATKMPSAQGDETTKLNNLFVGIDALYILVSPCADDAARAKAELAFKEYEVNEKRLIVRAQPPNNMPPHVFAYAVNANRYKYVRTIHTIIIDSLQSQGLLLRKKTSSKAGSSRPVSLPKPPGRGKERRRGRS